MERLLLFDVDLTLIDTGGCGRRAMSIAFEEILGNGHLAMKDVSFAGSTDGGIFRDALKKVNREWTQENQDAFRAQYLHYLKKEIVKPDIKQEVKPGIFDLLTALQQREDVVLALLTGNWEEGARIKLEHFELWQFFEFGAFSDDAWVRNELPPIAAKKFAEKYGKQIQPKQVFVIGDTPKDIQCTQPFGATSVAVATGHFSMQQLSTNEPDFLFENLADTGRFIRLLS